MLLGMTVQQQGHAPTNERDATPGSSTIAASSAASRCSSRAPGVEGRFAVAPPLVPIRSPGVETTPAVGAGRCASMIADGHAHASSAASSQVSSRSHSVPSRPSRSRYVWGQHANFAS